MGDTDAQRPPGESWGFMKNEKSVQIQHSEETSKNVPPYLVFPWIVKSPAGMKAEAWWGWEGGSVEKVPAAEAGW